MLSSGALKLPANTADLLSRLSPARLMKQLNGDYVDEEVRSYCSLVADRLSADRPCI